jgi:hypothetical protein
MQVAVGKNDETAILGFGVLACLLFAEERIFVFGFGLQYYQWESRFVEQQEVDESVGLSKFSPSAATAALVNLTFGSRTTFALLVPLSKKFQPVSSRSLLILMRALASFAAIRTPLCIRGECYHEVILNELNRRRQAVK